MIDSLNEILTGLIKEKRGLGLVPSYKAAELLGYSLDSMRALIRRGQFVAVKEGKTWITHPSLEVRKMQI
ncbi:Fic family protein [Methylacidiphilum infernorum V4]|uniref:Fic family protein n=1 Tax=Methylacidiphilum infernorum (isolate V4) TaxID=481448 RepID=B3DYC9_METI4|nr:Fic family protein [Methylacidiphilum infernorum V4]